MLASYLLIPYVFFAALSGLVFFFNIYHIGKFGLQSTRTTFVLALYTLGFLAVVVISIILLMQYDWTSTIYINDVLSPSSNGIRAYDQS